MAEASLLFPVTMIALSVALTGYIYRRDIAQGVQSSRRVVFHLLSRLIQLIDKMAKSTARWTYNIITGQHADHTNFNGGDYELVESPDLQHQDFFVSRSEGKHPFPSSVEAPSTANSPGTPGTPGTPDLQAHAMISDDGSSDVDDDLLESLVRSDRKAETRQSREHRHDSDYLHQQQAQQGTAVNVTADEGITPVVWEIDAAGRDDLGTLHTWFHGAVDRVVDKLLEKLEPAVVEIVDSV